MASDTTQDVVGGCLQESQGSSLLLAVRTTSDDSLGDKANLIIMTLDETTVNSMDIPTMVLLPELIYRWCFETELLGQ